MWLVECLFSLTSPEGSMRQRSRIMATLSAISVLLLALFLTRFSAAGEVSAPDSGSMMAIASNGSLESLLPNGNGDEGGPSATILDSKDVNGVLGSAVRSAADEDMGRIVDVIVDRTGSARAAVIDFGGFLGVGSRKIAVDWNAMRFGNDQHITLEMTRDQVKSAPQYEIGKPIVVLGASASLAQSRITQRMPEQ
jgi:hypothetical protein